MALSRPVLLTLRALKLGDLLTAVPALRALRRAFPDHEHLLVAPAWLAPLVDHLGVVDRLVPSATDPFAPGGPAGRVHDLLPPVDVAVNLHGRGPQSTDHLRRLRPGRLVAFDSGRGTPMWRAEEHEVERWCRLLSESGIPADPSDLRVDPSAGRSALDAAGATLVHPGAASAARRWPAERWAQVIRALARSGSVLITGGPNEVELAQEVGSLAGLPDSAVIAGETGLLDLLALVASADRLLCGDTGAAHVATAVGTPSVVLFGPVPPSLWGPPSAAGRHVALWAGRRGDPHGAAVDPGLLEITPTDVIDAVGSLVSRPMTS